MRRVARWEKRLYAHEGLCYSFLQWASKSDVLYSTLAAEYGRVCLIEHAVVLDGGQIPLCQALGRFRRHVGRLV